MTATDLDSRLRALAPSSRELADALPDHRREQLLTRALSGAPASSSRRHPRRWLISAAAATALTVAGFGVSSVLPPGSIGAPPPANALDALADQAARLPGVELRPNQFLYVVSHYRQDGPEPVHEGGKTQAWVAPDGWRWESRERGEYFIFAPSGAFADSAVHLPADAPGLERELRANVHGSTSQDEAVYVAISDLLRADALSSLVRSAALRVLAHTPHVTVTQNVTDPVGRRSIRATFVDDARRPGAISAIYLDPDTARLLADSTASPQGNWTQWFERRQVVDRLPAGIVAKLGTQRMEKQIIPGQPKKR